MSNETDIQKSARLAVEACMLTRFIFIDYIEGVFLDRLDDRALPVCSRAWQRFKRRLCILDAIISEQGDGMCKIYVGKCDENTPLGGLCRLTTSGGHAIYYDIEEFGNR